MVRHGGQQPPVHAVLLAVLLEVGVPRGNLPGSQHRDKSGLIIGMETLGFLEITLRQPQVMGCPVDPAEPGSQRIGKDRGVFPDCPRGPLIETDLQP
ncbi:MAG: hypothetical protein RBT40_13300, partial [Petrimonas sp.]|nr:hypothetical protein [Petrimonas sp.]